MMCLPIWEQRKSFPNSASAFAHVKQNPAVRLHKSAWEHGTNTTDKCNTCQAYQNPCFQQLNAENMQWGPMQRLLCICDAPTAENKAMLLYLLLPVMFVQCQPVTMCQLQEVQCKVSFATWLWHLTGRHHCANILQPTTVQGIGATCTLNTDAGDSNQTSDNIGLFALV